MTTELSNRCREAIEILQGTKDGDDLSPSDLAVVEAVVNGTLGEKLHERFQTILSLVRTKSYKQPWLCGVEHLTRDHRGYVYWKGQEIEHWSSGYAFSEEGKIAAKELEHRCQWLEQHNQPVNTTTVVWQWHQAEGEIVVPTGD